MIVIGEQLNVKQRQAISETPAKGGGGGLVESCFSLLGRMVAFPGKRPWLGCCLQGLALNDCYHFDWPRTAYRRDISPLRNRRSSTSPRSSRIPLGKYRFPPPITTGQKRIWNSSTSPARIASPASSGPATAISLGAIEVQEIFFMPAPDKD